MADAAHQPPDSPTAFTAFAAPFARIGGALTGNNMAFSDKPLVSKKGYDKRPIPIPESVRRARQQEMDKQGR